MCCPCICAVCICAGEKAEDVSWNLQQETRQLRPQTRCSLQHTIHSPIYSSSSHWFIHMFMTFHVVLLLFRVKTQSSNLSVQNDCFLLNTYITYMRIDLQYCIKMDYAPLLHTFTPIPMHCGLFCLFWFLLSCGVCSDEWREIFMKQFCK